MSDSKVEDWIRIATFTFIFSHTSLTVHTKRLKGACNPKRGNP